MKVAKEKNIEVDDINELIEQIYEKDDGTSASKISRNSVRKALEGSTDIQ